MNEFLQQPNLIFLVEHLALHYDLKTIDQILLGMTSKRVVSLRINTLKTTKEHILSVLDSKQITYENISWFHDGLIVHAKEIELESLDIYQQGMIYLQSLSSMIPPLIMELKPSIDILDMAAAPGGKTSEIAQLTNNESFITACEANPIRAEKLKFTLDRQGVKKTTVLIKDSTQLDDFFQFDQILLDAPCSGSGTILLHDVKTYQFFTKKLIDKSVEKQKAMLTKAIKLLKRGGEIVYSTCSILPDENEEIIRFILSKKQVELIPIDNKRFEGLPLLPSNLKGTLLIMPSASYEGFFVAKLKKIK
ncbi:MAG: RsmB/NOP family class I SAM-dependent RNA methyltransferase [Acholeplasmataceae bacterium]|jgi:NOL1/NOP2/sun family putative RNA methylase|nr:RsmB/NOP family class I SAM-dependent RNA methyltransferase [Acholeplasmataceae bacterium]